VNPISHRLWPDGTAEGLITRIMWDRTAKTSIHKSLCHQQHLQFLLQNSHFYKDHPRHPDNFKMEQQLNQLTPEQRRAILIQAQQQANQQIMQDMVQRMVKTCFAKCAGTSVSVVRMRDSTKKVRRLLCCCPCCRKSFVRIFLIEIPKRLTYCIFSYHTTKGDRLDSREQSCMASCQDQYLETRAQVQQALEQRQNTGMH